MHGAYNIKFTTNVYIRSNVLPVNKNAIM
jgi:hypothetical protein